MTGPEHVVVIGGGQSGAQLIDALRDEHDYRGRITLVCGEPHLPYQRPPLSKSYLVTEKPADWLGYRSRDFYTKRDVSVLLGRTATAIDRARRTVSLEGGTVLPYTRLALTTGSRVRRLTIPGSDDPHVRYIRSVEDGLDIRERLKQARKVVVIGAGFIGLEVAAILAQSGCNVTLLAADSRLIPRALHPDVSQFLRAYHEARGVNFVFDAIAAEIRPSAIGGVTVQCADGSGYDADLVLVGIGIEPEVALAEAAGLACSNGILVDEFATTSDPLIVAAGDCTSHPNKALGRHIRLETVHNAVEQAKVAAASIAGRRAPYDQAPWVWSDQFGLRIQSVGISEDCDEMVVRGRTDTAPFALFHFRDGAFMAMMSVNRPNDFAASRILLNLGLPLRPDQAANPTFDLRTLLPPRKPLDFAKAWPVRARRIET